MSCEEEPAWNKSEGCGSSGGVMEETSMSSVAVLASWFSSSEEGVGETV